MKPLLLTILILFLSGCVTRTGKIENALYGWEKQTSNLITELGVVYVGMPKEDLEKAGYTELIQKGYKSEGNEEWITFLNWTTEEPGDRVTFYIVDGKVKGWQEK